MSPGTTVLVLRAIITGHNADLGWGAGRILGAASRRYLRLETAPLSRQRVRRQPGREGRAAAAQVAAWRAEGAAERGPFKSFVGQHLCSRDGR